MDPRIASDGERFASLASTIEIGCWPISIVLSWLKPAYTRLRLGEGRRGFPCIGSNEVTKY